MLRAMIRNWFINPYHHVRALWRILLYVGLCFVLILGVRWLLGLVPFPEEGEGVLLTYRESVARGAGSAALIIAAFVMLRWVDKRPFAMLGLSLLTGWKRDFGVGIAIGLAMLTTCLVLLWAGGWMQVSLNEITPALLGGISWALLVFFAAALLEELMLRGYIFQAFIEGSRVWIAVILLSSVFSIMHFDNPSASVASSINVFLAGVLLSVCYLKTRSLWLPTGLHLGWNWVQSSFWGMGVSGFHVQHSVFIAEPQGIEWLSGGSFGPEASFMTTVVIAVTTIWIWKTNMLGVCDELQTAWAGYPRGFRQPPQSSAE